MSQSDDQLRAAVAAGVLRDEATHRELLGAIVQVARAIFHARAASVLLLDDATSELVFEAVVGEGEDTLIGRRFPSGTGVAGWVLATGQPLILTDVATDPRFSAETARSTGYVPQGIMAVPLIHGEDPIGVLEVLDRPANAQFSLDEVDLLGLFGAQAAAALELLRRARLADAALAGSDPGLEAVAQIAAHVGDREGGTAAGEFLQALNALLGRPRL
jgi:GAF domain-containing protein